MYRNLKAYRESLHLTQKDFAASLGIGLTTYNGYETGARDPKSDFWIAVAQKYGVTIDYLMGYSDDPYKTGVAAKNAPAYTAEALQIATKYDVLDDWGQQAVTGVVDVEHARCTAQAQEAAGAPARAPDAPDVQVAEKKRERKLQLVARRVEGVPEEEYERLLDAFEGTIDTYLEAKRIKRDDK